MNTKNELISGTQIQIDRSGQGHAWQDIDASDIPASIREEIEGEIIDGKQKTCSKFIASNGQHYRWSRANEKMKVQYYNTAIRELSEVKVASDIHAALTAIDLARYGNADAHLDNDYWRVIVDGEELTLEEAKARA